ncbi:MAG TPA: DeoR/GlpR family DNA-binding transcription regulator [Clostridia bacterium]|nr:DeoR/GlpR family DNA-binding transcription regulator [Clostridia bacterium]
MFAIERKNKLLSLIQENKSVLVQDMAAFFEVTEETIRRDLKELENSGLIMRTHGGAILMDDSKTEAAVEVREGINIPGKDAIAREAVKLIKDGDTIILDASTSSLFVAKHLKSRKGLTVITNAEKVVLELSGCEDFTLISTGGIFRHRSQSYVGKTAETALSNYHTSKVFISCKGFSPKKGLMDSNEQESDIRKAMLRCSEEAIFLCDSTKFDKVGYVVTAQLRDFSYFITDTPIPEDWSRAFDEGGVKMITAVSS